MAPPKQYSRSKKGKELLNSSVEEYHTRLVSEPSDGDSSSTPSSAEIAKIREVQYQLLTAFASLSEKFELLMQSRNDNVVNRINSKNVDTVIAFDFGNRANVVDRDDSLQGNEKRC